MDLCLINSWRRGVDTTVSKQTTVGRRGGGPSTRLLVTPFICCYLFPLMNNGAIHLSVWRASDGEDPTGLLSLSSFDNRCRCQLSRAVINYRNRGNGRLSILSVQSFSFVRWADRRRAH